MMRSTHNKERWIKEFRGFIFITTFFSLIFLIYIIISTICYNICY